MRTLKNKSLKTILLDQNMRNDEENKNLMKKQINPRNDKSLNRKTTSSFFYFSFPYWHIFRFPELFLTEVWESSSWLILSFWKMSGWGCYENIVGKSFEKVGGGNVGFFC